MEVWRSVTYPQREEERREGEGNVCVCAKCVKKLEERESSKEQRKVMLAAVLERRCVK